MKAGDLVIAVGLAIVFAAAFATMFDLAPIIAKAMVRQAARWWKSDLDTPEQLAEEWEALVEERPVGLLKIGTGLRFWVQGAIRLSRFAAEQQTTRVWRLLLKLAEVPGLVLLKIAEFAGLVSRSLRAAVIAADHSPSELSSAVRVLAYGRFRWYFATSMVSNTGTWLQNTTQVVLAYQLTHSVSAVGLVTCAQFSSTLVLGPWAGVLTHRLGNWRALIFTQVASAITTATLAVLQFSGALNMSFLVMGVVATGLAFTFALPAQSVTVITLVPKSETKLALVMDSLSYNLGRVLGPVFTVLIITTIGSGWAFALNAGSFLLFAAVLLLLRPGRMEEYANRSRVMSGLRVAWDDRRIMILLLMVAAVTVAINPILVVGPALTRAVGVSPVWASLFIAALGAGNVIGSFRPTRQAPSIRRAAAVLFMLAVSMMIFVTAQWIWLSVAAAVMAGMACLFAGATTRALLLQCAGMRQAAVMAAWAVAWAGSMSIASLADGTLAGAIGVRPTGILLALPALVPALVLILRPRMAQRIAHEPTLAQLPRPAFASRLVRPAQVQRFSSQRPSGERTIGP